VNPEQPVSLSLLPPGVEPVCSAYLSGLRRILGDTLHGLYLYGAVAFPEAGPTGDLDLHAMLNQAPDRAQRQKLARLRRRLVRAYPPLGAELDAWFILWQDALRPEPPLHLLVPGLVDVSWALHRAHLRAGRCFVLHGPEPSTFLPEPSWPELEEALRAELDYCRAHLTDYPAYCVLNLCRLIYSFQTRNVVVSKRASAAWALPRFPGWEPLIGAALAAYDRKATGRETELLADHTASFFGFACRQIDGSVIARSRSDEAIPAPAEGPCFASLAMTREVDGDCCASPAMIGEVDGAGFPAGIEPGQAVEVTAYKADGSRYRWFQAAVESAAPDRLALVTPVGHAVHGRSGDWISPWAMRGTYRPGLRYFLLEVYAGDGQLAEVYANVNSPALVEAGRLWYTDYELDVSRLPPGPPRVVDEEEFAEAAARYGYTPEFQAECYRVAAEALEVVRGWTPQGPPLTPP
jgi:protein associated with RNAse G/E